ncbi:MAG: TetR/AcrR family transcriptional regulator C-terminal domain-containing protein [Clostridium perfringens]|nr:TetR/AcrR family transcriptional regulator C-terminal domain-containing protein [Clostridium perfringens]
MPNSLTTEIALANSLKTLMLTKSINKITVKEVTDRCKVTRRTFYNHFNDTYELLGWIYEHEVIEELDEYYNLDGWKIAIKKVLDYTLSNRVICLNTFNSLAREYLERFLYNIFSSALRGIIDDITKDINVDNSIKEEYIRFYTLAIIGEFILWLKGGLKEKCESIINRMERVMGGTLYAIMKSNEK